MGWIAMKPEEDVHDPPRRMDPIDFCDALTFNLTPPAGQNHLSNTAVYFDSTN